MTSPDTNPYTPPRDPGPNAAVETMTRRSNWDYFILVHLCVVVSSGLIMRVSTIYGRLPPPVGKLLGSVVLAGVPLFYLGLVLTLILAVRALTKPRQWLALAIAELLLTISHLVVLTPICG